MKTTLTYFLLIFKVSAVTQAMQTKCSMPPTFGSFNGRPAKVLNDCVWDFAKCTDIRNDLKCCQVRFQECCKFVTKTTTTTTTSTTTTTTTTPYRHADTMIGCVWQFNNCIQQKVNNLEPDESICYTRYEECKMIMMGVQSATELQKEESQQMEKPDNGQPRKMLIECVWEYFLCHDENCQANWDTCMSIAMRKL